MPTIALVDDDRNILTSVSIALEAEGHRITAYTDGASAPVLFEQVSRRVIRNSENKNASVSRTSKPQRVSQKEMRRARRIRT